MQPSQQDQRIKLGELDDEMSDIDPRIETLLHQCRIADNASSVSDIHISEDEVPWLRIDGDLVKFEDFGIISGDTIKQFYETYSDGNMNIQSILQERGHYSLSGNSEKFGDVRIHILRKDKGTDLVIRLLNANVPDLKKLLLPDIISTFTDTPSGLYLFTGATGSGKSTAMAALVNDINKKYEYSIFTIEDPIEYRHKSIKSLIRQQTIGKNFPTYQEAIKSALRSDPDVILIGEMRDPETMRAALTAAETGHLVLSTLHDNGACETVQRIIGSFSGNEQAQVQMSFSTVMKGIISMRLVKKASGNGRLPVTEIMVNNTAIANQIRKGQYEQLRSTLEQGKGEGMHTLESELNRLYQSGEIALEEAKANANLPDEIKKVTH